MSAHARTAGNDRTRTPERRRPPDDAAGRVCFQKSRRGCAAPFSMQESARRFAEPFFEFCIGFKLHDVNRIYGRSRLADLRNVFFAHFANPHDAVPVQTGMQQID